MQVFIRVVSDGLSDVHDLYRWLSEDPDVRNEAEVELAEAEAFPEALGALELINVVISNATALGSLLVSISTWRSARGREAEVRVERNGVRVSVEGADPEAIQDLLRQLSGTATDTAQRGSDDAGSTEEGSAEGVR
ncbi:hypothetical protein ACF1A5_26895 [Streptomyces sp. NPDC014864]|uniref:effector-associated constant component EACC1 n=1 Tax=Streptomyces sp. NPDC014864 TaxID=3364924 RepID=UPI0036FAB00A